MKLPANPFPTATYYGADYFCDRNEETSRLINTIKNNSSTTLMALRRIGKTGLIQHTLSRLPKDTIGIYIDILATENLNRFLNLLATSILNAIPEKTGTGKKFWDFVKSLRPVITFDALTGTPQAFFDIKQKETETNISHVLQFLEKQDFKTVIAIDEFQQILNYPEKNTDAWLRAQIQQLKNVVFIFSGSQLHLMSDLFTSPNRPFFRSTQIMKLEKIDPGTYSQFIVTQFEKYNKEITLEIARNILAWANTHTFYVQQICNRVFSATHKKVTIEGWKQQAYLILKEQETVFFSYRNMLTNPQWQLFKAIAHEGIVYQLTSKAFLNKYHLGTSATVLRSLKALQGYELVYREFDKQGISYYSVYDVFFQQWSQWF